ncbi:carboxypeptidase Q-like [Haemaphysalis longicornis]
MLHPVLPFLYSTMLLEHARGPNNNGCNLPASLAEQIGSYEPLVRRILAAFDGGPLSGTTYSALAEFVDWFGHRIVGSESLEAGIDHLVESLEAAGVDRVWTEPVETPVWIRGKEEAFLVEPRRVPLAVLGLGGSVATPPGGITAPVVVVRSFEELDRRQDEVNGTIVLFNPEWIDYFQYVPHRSQGASRAARYGAVGALIRSATSKSLYTLHTGMLRYDSTVPKIPAASVTVEDADFLTRLADRGSRVVVHLEMSNNHSQGVSRNIIADIVGSVHPEQFVILGAHTDSWDVGQGAIDDGGGVFIGLAAMAYVRRLQQRPRRTLRLVLWTSEENGLVGSAEFVRKHRDEMVNISLALESDFGTFAPLGLTTTSENNVTRCILQRVLSLLVPIGATRLEDAGQRGSDVVKLAELGVPASILLNRNERYFDYHHTHADTVSALNSRDMDRCAALWTAVGYIVADLREMLPRN